MKIMTLAVILSLAAPAFAAAETRHTYHPSPQDLFQRHARILQSDQPGDFRVLVSPNLVPKPPALVTAVAAGKAHCARLGRHDLRLTNVERHAVQDISSWAMDFICR
ncbi:hypothetical protein [Oceaniglobus indicus]|uniref:hypothetical protein n=1 Tax=Oceaniglobus indicus TaxID=2047749 RepID=UPI000C195A0A|nr:hypothetical protein [Oceaniglobus indicus]